MDVIHTLEADQPMLSFLGGLYDNLRVCFEEFSEAIPHLATGEVPVDKRKKDGHRATIDLVQQFDQDTELMWRPVMSAAAVLDPLNWDKNGMGKYHVPVHKHSERMQKELNQVVMAFETAEGSGEGDLISLALHVFPGAYTKHLDKLTERAHQGWKGY